MDLVLTGESKMEMEMMFLSWKEAMEANIEKTKLMVTDREAVSAFARGNNWVQRTKTSSEDSQGEPLYDNVVNYRNINMLQS